MGQMVGTLHESESHSIKKTKEPKHSKNGSEDVLFQLEKTNKFDRESCKIKKNQKWAQDDVTQAPLRSFPFKTAGESPSISDEPSMSSIVATTTLKDESSNVNNSGINTSKMIPKRSWSGYQLFHLTNSKGDRMTNSPRLIRSPKIRPNNSTTKTSNIVSKKSVYVFHDPNNDKKIDNIMPRPLFKAAGEHLHIFSQFTHADGPTETNTDMDQLITMMQNHKVSDDSPAFNFCFEPPKSKNHKTHTSSSFIPPPEFQFSLSANIPQSNNIDLCTAISTSSESCNHDTSKDAPNESSFSHLQHRKILPLPKPRWKRSNKSPMPPAAWPWKTPSKEGSISSHSNSSHGTTEKISSIHGNQDQAGFLFFPSSSIDNSRDNSKKMKRSGAPTAPLTEEDAEDDVDKTKDSLEDTIRNSPRRKESKWRSKGNDKRSVPNVVFDFTLDETTKEKLMELSNLKGTTTSGTKPLSLPLPSTTPQPAKTISTHKNTPPPPVEPTTHKSTSHPKKDMSEPPKVTQIMSKKLPTNQNKRPPNAHKKKKTKAAVLTEDEASHPPEPASQPPPTKEPTLPPQHRKASVPNAAVKKNKKRNNKKEVEIAPGGFLSSDVTLFQNPISDDWICLFCQYDILCYGLEDTRKKTGYYRRKRERLRRIKEAELRRMGGLSESEVEDDHSEDHHL